MTNFIPKININKVEFLTKNLEQKMDIFKFIEEWNSDKTTITLKTSGSTGPPKEIIHNKTILLHSAKKTIDFFTLNSKSKIALCLSTKTIAGKMQMIRALVLDAPLYVFELNKNPFKNSFKKVDFCSLTPLQLNSVLDNNPSILREIKYILLGGARINNDLILKIKKNDLINIYEGFGMTETVSHVALRKIDSTDEKPFQVLDGVNITQKNGNLVIDAEHLKIKNLVTNDVVELVDNQSFYWKGRADFVINSGGFKFFPEILENKLSSDMPFSFFIIGQKDILYDEIITLFVEAEENELNKEILHKIINHTLDKYEKPKKIYFVSSFELTQSGKINRILTRDKAFES